MKQLSILFIALAAWCAAGAQAQLFGYKDYNFANQVNVGKGSGQVTNPAAWLEIGPASGSTKGILMPRGDRHAITTPVLGLVIYDTNDGKFYYYNGNSWQPLGSVDPTVFVQNQNSQAQTANFWVNGSGRIDGSLTLGGVLKHAQLVADPTGTSGMVYYQNSASPGLRTFTNSTWKYILTGTSADGSGDFIKSQSSVQQVADFWIRNAKVGGTLTLLNPLQHATLAADPTGANGQTYYNTTSNKIRGYINGAWDNIASEAYVNGQIRTGNYIYVDVNNPASTDSRGTFSKYSLTTPFKTISAAVAAFSNGDVIYVRSGTYNENVSIASQSTINVVLDNCTVNGGTGNAFFVTGSAAYNVNVYMINAVITNTGDAANPQTKAAFYSNICNVSIYGNSRFTCKISSTNSSGLFNNQGGSLDPIYLDNISVTSTNNYAYYDTGIAGSVTACAFTSTNSSAMNASQFVVDRCTFTGYTSAISSGGFLGLSTITNSTFTSSNGTGFNAPGLVVGAVAAANVFRISNCTFNTYAEPIAPQGANASVGYNFSVENCKFSVSHATTIFNLVTAIGGSNAHSVKLLNAISNVPAFSSSFRTTDAAYINESNTNTGSTINFGINVGFGSTAPTSAVDITGSAGYNQLRIRTQYTPTGSADANGNAGDISVDDNYLYYKTSTGWKRMALSTF